MDNPFRVIWSRLFCDSPNEWLVIMQMLMCVGDDGSITPNINSGRLNYVGISEDDFRVAFESLVEKKKIVYVKTESEHFYILADYDILIDHLYDFGKKEYFRRTSQKRRAKK